jgi:hypothetical protein
VSACPSQQRERITFPVSGNADDLAAVIDVARQAFVSSERSKIDDLAALLPQDSPALRYSQDRVYPAIFGEPDELTGVIAPDGEAVDTTQQRAEISDRPSPPAKCVKNETLGAVGLGIAVSANPITIPVLLMKGNSWVSALFGPPRVPRSMSR